MAEWDKLREFDGSVENAFEELCAQLARADSLTANHCFVRNGKPDGGLECYATCHDGSQIGWQAKWFRRPPTQVQWRQLDESFASALATYPKLVTFIVCLPQDRANAGGRRNLTMEAWDRAVRRWKAAAIATGRAVEVDYWGTSEIFDRLGQTDHRGRLAFWFDRECFPSPWFRSHFDEVWANNKKRYRPELDVDLPPTSWLDPLLQTKQHLSLFRESLGQVCAAMAPFDQWSSTSNVAEGIAALRVHGETIRQLATDLPTGAEGPVPSAAAVQTMHAIVAVMHTQLHAVPDGCDEKATNEWYRAGDELRRAIQSVEEFTSGLLQGIHEARCLLLQGDAGQGKTHLLFRIADERTRDGLPVVVSCGIQYTKGDPWKQMIDGLGLTYGRDEFLGALNAAAEARQTRALVIVDALNESDDPTMWKRALAGILKTVRRFPFLVAVFSTRREFADVVVPPTIPESDFPRVLHHGFRGHETRATGRVFGHFGITAPDVPLLDPEFSNPLFVVTLAESLQAAGLRTIPQGAHGLRWVFKLWLDGIDTKLSSPRELDYDPAERRVERATAALASAMSNAGTKVLLAATAKTIINKVHPAGSWSKSLFRSMLSEDVIQKVRRFSSEDREWLDCVRFTFDRFADQRVAEAILRSHPNRTSLKRALAPRGNLRRILVRRHDRTAYPDPGWLRALAIELPEDPRYRCELSDVFPAKEFVDSVEEAIVASVLWRSPETISARTVQLMRRALRSAQGLSLTAQCLQIETCLQLAVRKDHPLNAFFLDKELRREPMPRRDYWWSRPLTALGAEEGIVMRLIDWMLMPSARASDDETARLASVATAWLFATSNRLIRDRATKAMVSLLLERPAVVAGLVEMFVSVDDLYIVERVLAVAYGVALRTHDLRGLGSLATTVHDRCFQGRWLPEHLLGRDYARGIVECAILRNAVQGIDLSAIQPPYTSAWPRSISRHDLWDRRAGHHMWKRAEGLCRVWSSIKNGNFGRYILGANYGHHDWLRIPLFGLADAEISAGQESNETKKTRMSESALVGSRETSSAEGVEYVQPPRSSLRSGTAAVPAPAETETEWRSWFPVAQIQCMVMDDVSRSGYSSRLDDGVETLDRDGGYSGRKGQRAERMGKKYQWVAYWRTLARIADRFQFRHDRQYDANHRYEGPWQLIGGRDIDPSCILRRKVTEHVDPDRPSWWAPFAKTDFERKCDDKEWLQDASRTPSLEEICEATGPDGKRWIVGWLFNHLRAESHEGLVPAGWRRRTAWYYTIGVFVRAEDSGRLVTWLNAERRRQGENGHRLLPERPHLSECFLGEFPLSAAWSAEAIPYYDREPWHVHRGGSPVPCSLLADCYVADDDRDCGRDEYLEFCLPSAELVTGLSLRQAAQDGHFENAAGRLIAWDPSITEKGPRALLLDRDSLLGFAQKQGFHVVLLTYGEQRAHSDRHDDHPYLGQVLVSGVFVHDGRGWKGSSDGRFDPPPTRG